MRACSLLLAIALLFAGLAPSQARAENFAGRWHLTFYGRCVLTAANTHACAALQAPAWFAIYAHPGATLTVRGVGTYFADRRGRYTVRFITIITERVPGRGAPTRCTNATVFESVWTGTCEEVGQGHGRIAPGATGMDDFWQTDTVGYWKGQPPVPFAARGATDTMNPACPGALGTAAFLRLLGIRQVPRGIDARLVLTHRL